MTIQYLCAKGQRRQAVLGSSALNGIDFLEVLDQQAAVLASMPPSPRQQTLLVHFLRSLPPLTPENVRIEGGVRITHVNVVWASPAQDSPKATAAEQEFFNGLTKPERILAVRTDVAGDFSTYTLRLVKSPTDSTPPDTIDARFAAIEFSFKVECPTDFDCQSDVIRPAESLPGPPPIDYLAKDYSGFRTLMLDRLAVTMPGWQEESPADLGNAVVEVLAYAADRLSYFQDAVATEAYLGTARRRVSVRRHARLLDYAMHDGCNARVWVHIEVKPGSSADGAVLPGADPKADPPRPGTALFTQINAPRGAFPNDAERVRTAFSQGPMVFETLHDIGIFAAHNEMHFYTWGDELCCLPRGATEATLRNDGKDGPIRLAGGDALLLEEALSPATGIAPDADPAHRWIVRLTSVTPAIDSLTKTAVVEIVWSQDDALPFPLSISTAKTENISVARGNIVLADHGRTIQETVENARLRNTDVTFSRPFDAFAAAARSLVQDPRAAAPAITLFENGKTIWKPLRDLLEAGPFDPNFVVETEDDGTATLRFGDGILGATPTTGFTASYRIGNGIAGHAGAEAIAHVITKFEGIQDVRNPLPSQGGVDPQPTDQVRRYAPRAFRTQERAVTEEDYAAVAGRHPEVEKAEATLRSTGAWHTVFVTVQRRGGWPIDGPFRDQVRTFLERFRLAGFDLEVEAPLFVPLDIAFTVQVAPGHFQSDVEQALIETFSNRDLADGGRGFFHPDNFTFGQPVYLSPIVAAAMRVPGVLEVETFGGLQNRFQRFGVAPSGELEAGRIPLARLEIARLDNDPNEAENGGIQFFMEGGS